MVSVLEPLFRTAGHTVRTQQGVTPARANCTATWSHDLQLPTRPSRQPEPGLRPQHPHDRYGSNPFKKPGVWAYCPRGEEESKPEFSTKEQFRKFQEETRQEMREIDAASAFFLSLQLVWVLMRRRRRRRGSLSTLLTLRRRRGSLSTLLTLKPKYSPTYSPNPHEDPTSSQEEKDDSPSGASMDVDIVPPPPPPEGFLSPTEGLISPTEPLTSAELEAIH